VSVDVVDVGNDDDVAVMEVDSSPPGRLTVGVGKLVVVSFTEPVAVAV